MNSRLSQEAADVIHEAARWLRDYVALHTDNNFLTKMKRELDSRGGLTKAQWDAVIKNYRERRKGGEAEVMQRTNEKSSHKVEQAHPDIMKIADLFRRARAELNDPMVRLIVNGTKMRLTSCETRLGGALVIRLSYPGQGSRSRSVCSIAADTGTITWYCEPRLKPMYESALRIFGANPAQVAASFGDQTHACCFCGKRLTDDRSTSVGYGPICADHYGLPWGEDDESCTNI